MRVFHPTPSDMHGDVVPLSDGAMGIMQTLKQMRKYVAAGRVDPRIVESARSIVLMCPGKDTIAEIQTLFQYVRDRIRYVNDVLETETLSPAWYTLHTRSGDCDDKSVLLASLLEAIGIETRFCVTGYDDGGNFSHVHVLACPAPEMMIDLDTTEPYPMGWSAPDPTVRHVECLDSDSKGFWDILSIFGIGSFL